MLRSALNLQAQYIITKLLFMFMPPSHIKSLLQSLLSAKFFRSHPACSCAWLIGYGLAPNPRVTNLYTMTQRQSMDRSIKSGHLILTIPWTPWPLLLFLTLLLAFTASSWNKYHCVHQQLPPPHLGTTETARPRGHFCLLSKLVTSSYISH